MTNQLQFLETANNIILLNEGEIAAQGSYSELKEKGYDQNHIYYYLFINL
jgi:ABC-type transport system involved in cytochrome bd biosynthesis fused ATPase/permease subunit